MAETNARKRPIGFVEASTVETDDFLLIDGQTSGTRKIKPDKVGKANTSDLNNDAGFQNASEVAAAIAANIDDGLDTAGKAADSKAVGDALATKVDAASGKGLSSNDYTTAEKTKLAGVATGATRVLIDSGLSESGKAADAAAVSTALAGKVDKATGKGLSTNDYTTAEKTKLAGIQDGAAAVDATLTVTGKAADAKKTGDEITHVKQDINALEEGKADASGTAENLTAGNAEQLLTDKGITDKVPYLLRASGGNGADREEDKIVGGTVAWNQLMQNGNFADTSIWQTVTSATLSVSNNVGTVNIAAHNSSFIYQSITSIASHKYLITFDVKSDDFTGGYLYWFGVSLTPTKEILQTWKTYNFIVQSPGSGVNMSFRIVNGHDAGSVQFRNWNVIDLTQMFGTAIADRAYALERTTSGSGIAWLKSMGFFTKDYYPYDAGSLKSVEGLTAHSMVGFNQWDEEWEVGGINHSTGENTSVSTVIRSKNYMPCLGNTTYFLRMNSGTDINAYVHYYNSDKAFVGYVNVNANNTFTTPTNASYIRINVSAAYGTTYKNDICINLSDPAKNGTYEPYKTWSYPLDSTLTLRGIPKLDANNQVYYDGDTYESDGTVTRRYGVVDLGTLTWTRYNFSSTYAFYASVDGRKSQSENTVCAKYPSVIASPGSLTDKTMNATANGTYVYIRDDSYTDATTFKTAMNGVYLVYELATSTTEEADPYQNPQIVDDFGTEEYETTGIVPVGHSTFYPENLRSKIEGLPFNFATLIAPTESTYKATRAYSANNLFIVDNVLYKATASIASGGTITPGTNCTATTLAEIIAALS